MEKQPIATAADLYPFVIIQVLSLKELFLKKMSTYRIDGKVAALLTSAPIPHLHSIIVPLTEM